MPDQEDLSLCVDQRDLVHDVVARLAAGQLVSFPTETGPHVAASLLNEDAVRKFAACDSQTDDPFILGLKSADEALDYVPAFPCEAAKLARRAWPSPLSIETQVHSTKGLTRQLPDSTRRLLMPDGWLATRVPSADFLQECLRFLPCPVILSPDTLLESEQQDESTFGNLAVDLRLTGVTRRHRQLATRVRFDQKRWWIIRQGILTLTSIRRFLSIVYLFVCTGNTCRSPMAEGLFRRVLAERVGCEDDELVDHGFVVESAGLAASFGGGASPESVQLMEDLGIDISSHEPRQLTVEMLMRVDRVFTMTRQHRAAIVHEFPQVADRVEVLSRNGQDVRDPIGGGLTDYAECQREIEENIRLIAADVPL